MIWAALQFEYTVVLLPYLILCLHLVFVFTDVKNNICIFYFFKYTFYMIILVCLFALKCQDTC